MFIKVWVVSVGFFKIFILTPYVFQLFLSSFVCHLGMPALSSYYTVQALLSCKALWGISSFWFLRLEIFKLESRCDYGFLTCLGAPQAEQKTVSEKVNSYCIKVSKVGAMTNFHQFQFPLSSVMLSPTCFQILKQYWHDHMYSTLKGLLVGPLVHTEQKCEMWIWDFSRVSEINQVSMCFHG